MVKRLVTFFIGEKEISSSFTFSSSGNGSKKFLDILSIVVKFDTLEYFTSIRYNEIFADKIHQVFALKNGESVHNQKLSPKVLKAFMVTQREAAKFVKELDLEEDRRKTIYNGGDVFIANNFACSEKAKISNFAR